MKSKNQMPTKYLTADDMPKSGRRRTMTIRAIEREVVDGRPRLVLYFEGEKRGLLLTKQLADDLTQGLGPNPMVNEFFASEGTLH